MKNEKPVPETLREAIDTVKTELIQTVAAYDLAMRDPEGFRVQMHHTYGRAIRNDWGLWKGGSLKDELENLGIYHPDDMSDHILKTAVQELRDAEFRAWAKRGKKDGEEEV